MSDIHKSLRLGDLLVEKGLISPQQLREAIELQAARRESHTNQTSELGQLLLELGYIDRFQLKQNLNWQRRLKATTAVMVFVAPLLTAACGGGGGSAAGATTVTQPPPSTQTTQPPASNTQTSSQITTLSSAQSSAASLSPAPIPATSAARTSSTAPVPKSSSASSVPIVGGVTVKTSSSSKSSSAPVSSVPKNSTSSSVASSAATALNGPVQLYWKVPIARENGEYLDITEIGGYELRYKLKSDANYKSVIINDGYTDAYYFNNLVGDYEFEIATFDVNGVYSNFIPVSPSS